MKKFLKVLGILLILAGIASLLIGIVFGYAYYYTMDGSAGMYTMQQKLMIIFLLIGLILFVAGILCLKLCKKFK